MSQTDATLTWEEAVRELEQLVAEVEDPRLPVDALAGRVERAAALIRWCRGVLARTEVQVEEALALLEEARDGDPDPDET
jgi:exodeoxyribonuclease VII small subunit